MQSTSSSFSKAFLDASRKGGAWMTALKVAAGAAAALAGARLLGAGVRFAGGGGGSGQGRSRSSGMSVLSVVRVFLCKVACALLAIFRVSVLPGEG